VEIADTFATLGGYSFLPPHQAYARAKAAVQKALELDPGMRKPAGTLFVLFLFLFPFKPAFGGEIVVLGEGGGVLNASQAGDDFTAVAAGNVHGLALRSDGTVASWDVFEEEAAPTQDAASPENGFVAIAASGFHSLALREDGSIAAWGDNIARQLDVPEGNDFVAIAAGAYHGLALRADGSIAAWGDDSFGQTDLPEDNSGFVDIAGGLSFSMALKGSETAIRTVPIDIEPFIYPNRLNLRSSGVLAVAIFGSESFDATRVDPKTVTISDAGIITVGRKQIPMAFVRDLNRDGLGDLVFFFNIHDLVLDPENTIAVLTGNTYDGERITGEDTVRVVQPRQNKKTKPRKWWRCSGHRK
jgi:hypothetical protein